MAYYKFCFEKQSSAQTIVRSRRGGERLLKLQQPLSSNSIFAAGGEIARGGGAGAKASFFYFSSFVTLNGAISGCSGSSVAPWLIMPPCVTRVHTHARLHDQKRRRRPASQRGAPRAPLTAAPQRREPGGPPGDVSVGRGELPSPACAVISSAEANGGTSRLIGYTA